MSDTPTPEDLISLHAMIFHERAHEIDRFRVIGSDDPLWAAYVEWAEFHHIDTTRVPIMTTVTRDADACRIIYARMLLDEDGGVLVRGGEPVVETAVEQGEAPPKPFPEDTSVWDLLTDPRDTQR